MSSAASIPDQGDDPRVNPGAERLEADPDRSGPATERPEPGEDASSEEIEADIARTRRDLGETVEALSGKLDPKAQASQQVTHLKERAREQADHARRSAQSTLTHARHVVADPDNPVPGLVAAATGAVVFAAIGLLIVRRG